MSTSLPSSGWRADGAAGRLGEAALIAGVALAALAFTPTDATLNVGVVDPVAPAARFVPEPSLHFQWLTASLGRAPVAVPKYQPPIPTSPPATILIPSLNVHRPVEAVGLDRRGTLDVPQNLWNAGWFKWGPTPGAPGDAVIEGHAGYPNAPLLFARIGQLRPGSQIVVVLADGSRRLFLVDSSASWPAGTVPPGLGDPTGEPRLSLITCGGAFDDQNKTYADRVVVEASYAGLAT